MSHVVRNGVLLLRAPFSLPCIRGARNCVGVHHFCVRSQTHRRGRVQHSSCGPLGKRQKDAKQHNTRAKTPAISESTCRLHIPGGGAMVGSGRGLAAVGGPKCPVAGRVRSLDELCEAAVASSRMDVGSNLPLAPVS